MVRRPPSGTRRRLNSARTSGQNDRPEQNCRTMQPGSRRGGLLATFPAQEYLIDRSRALQARPGGATAHPDGGRRRHFEAPRERLAAGGGNVMRASTSLKFLFIISAAVLIAIAPQPAFAQRGGGGHGGGGGFHGGGGFGGGGFNGGAYAGGYANRGGGSAGYGGYRGAPYGGYRAAPNGGYYRGAAPNRGYASGQRNYSAPAYRGYGANGAGRYTGNTGAGRPGVGPAAGNRAGAGARGAMNGGARNVNPAAGMNRTAANPSTFGGRSSLRSGFSGTSFSSLGSARSSTLATHGSAFLGSGFGSSRLGSSRISTSGSLLGTTRFGGRSALAGGRVFAGGGRGFGRGCWGCGYGWWGWGWGFGWGWSPFWWNPFWWDLYWWDPYWGDPYWGYGYYDPWWWGWPGYYAPPAIAFGYN